MLEHMSMIVTTSRVRSEIGDTSLRGAEPMSDHPGFADSVRERATRLFQYLAALVELRSKMVRDCGSYENLFWFSEVPREPECFTPAWLDKEEADDGVWLRICRPHRPRVPQPPFVCQSWLGGGCLEDASRQPSLLDEIDAVEPTDVGGSNTMDQEACVGERLRLEDHPEALEAWRAYIEDEWIPWSEDYRRWQRVQSAYARLFAMYQAQRRRGEQLELSVGLGVLVWTSSSGHRVCRPIVVGDAAIALDSTTGTIAVTAAPEGARFRLEQDMLEVAERPPVDIQRSSDREVSELESPWDRSIVFDLLRGWVHSLPQADATFSESLSCPEIVERRPQIAYAPVLMLRKRSGQTLGVALKKTIEQLENGGPIPQGIRQACGDYSAVRDGAIGARAVSPAIPDEVLFPLPTNDEQKSILNRLNGRPAIVVQGPPGTGKSHTIVNLVCHFLSHGKRVLVTSQTPRALRVLQRKIPERIRSLCLSLLGNDTDSLRNLEASVQGILREIDGWSPEERDPEIEEVQRQRRACLSQLAQLRQQEQAIRQTETVQQRVPKTSYVGTAQAIAQRLEREAEGVAWLRDDPEWQADAPLTPAQLNELAMLWADCDVDLLAYSMPDVEELPDPDKFARAVASYSNAERRVQQLEIETEDARVTSLSRLTEGDLSMVKQTAIRFRDLLARVTRCPDAWVKNAVGEILSGSPRLWQSLSAFTDQALARLRPAAEIPEPAQFVIPADVTEEQMLADARDLLGHLKSKKGLGFFWFRPAVAKRTQYLWKDYRFGGQLCNNVDALQELIAHLERIDTLSKAWREWSEHATPPVGGFRHRLAKLEEFHEVLKGTLELHSLAVGAEARLASQGVAPGQPIATDWAESLVKDIDGASAFREQNAAKSNLETVIRPIVALSTISNLHPTAIELTTAARDLAPLAYRHSLSAVGSVAERRDAAERCMLLNQRLFRAAPLLAESLRNPDLLASVAPHLGTFTQAWEWKLAKQWLDRSGTEAESGQVAAQIRTVESQLASLTQRAVELLAWRSCYHDLSADLEMQGALQAWQLLVRKIGRGTGKHVETYRRDARKYMDKCRTAIPAWIMPLHRVAETVEVHAGSFDVVIIDEASQTGPEGLILQYLGKQCIIVGDDKQISPEAVGVNMDNVRELMKQHLNDFPFFETLTPNSSLFDQAMVRYGGNRVVLREHFRCMPEIIRFSNDLCYHDTPLVPLRAYPPQRLEPIMVRSVIDGYREGEVEAVVNRPEAAAVVKTIIDCLHEPRYAGKSMGVICLQGHAQAKLIEQMLLDAVGLAPFEERQLICGDPYSFQGDERDVVFLSMVAASEGDSRTGALVKESYRQRFNVAASRARDQVWLFHSISEHELSPKCMRRRLLNYFYHPEAQVQPQDISRCESKFERDVARELVRRNYRVIPQYPAANRRIDLVIEGTKSRLAIECDGDEWHGPDRYEADMARQRMLERCGWKFERVRGSSFYANRHREIARIIEQLETQGITPISDPADDRVGHWIAEICGHECAEELRSPDTAVVSQASGGEANEPSDSSNCLEFAENDGPVTEAQECAADGTGQGQTPTNPDVDHGNSILVGPLLLNLDDAEELDAARLGCLKRAEELSNDALVIHEVVEYGESVWLRLSRWGKVNETLTPKERKFVYDVGRRIRDGSEPTIRQARWAIKILEEAMENGFELEVSD
jgi:very-short-patch-repair endonuclease